MAPLQALRDEPEQNEEGEEEGEQEGCGPYNLFDMFEDAAAAEAGEEEAEEEEEENSMDNATTAVLGGDVARLADVADGGDHECGESEEEAEEDSCVDPGDIPQADSVPQPERPEAGSVAHVPEAAPVAHVTPPKRSSGHLAEVAWSVVITFS